MTEREIEIVGHSLGINVYHAKRSSKKRDKKLPVDFYRNYFCAGDKHSDIETIKCLIKSGSMRFSHLINDGRESIYIVTQTGMREFVSEFKAYVS